MVIIWINQIIRYSIIRDGHNGILDFYEIFPILARELRQSVDFVL